MEQIPKKAIARVLAPLMETFGLSRGLAVGVVVTVSAIISYAVFWFFDSAPPRTLIISSGPPGSLFETNAVSYARILATNGVRVKILHSNGSMDNLEKLKDPSIRLDIGFVQTGITSPTNAVHPDRLVSLGSISYEPLLVFYRGAAPISLLSELRGKRLALGPEGGGTRALGMALLALNGLGPADVTLVDSGADDAAKALLDGGLDAVFLMGDSASPAVMRRFLVAPGIQLYDFKQANGYIRRIPYLNKLVLPMGSMDFGKNIPASDVTLLAPTVEILARPGLHPALSDLILDAARQTHGGAKLLQQKGEFPSPLAQDHDLSPDAARFYKSGKGFLYNHASFWVASLIDRVLVAFVPMLVLLVPALRLIPAAYRFRMRLRILRWYRLLLRVERELTSGPVGAGERAELLGRLDHIEKSVNKMKVPASFADQFYALRTYVIFVRGQVIGKKTAD
jgi:TRAP-type uncharacterized transport system substrate-binding protein